MRLFLRAAVAAIVAAIVVSIVVACGPEPPPSLVRDGHPTQLAGTAWRLVELRGVAPAPGPDVTLEFTGDRLGGTAPCNSFGAAYAYDPATGALRIDALISTKRACVVGVRNDLEGAYFAALRTVTEADIDAAGRLVLVGSGGPVVFEVGGRPVLPPPSRTDPGPS